ncbi:GAF domain-containing SpoIIE family protein phosphatase [Nocardioides marmotae]|uniref:protein-serine/threonine phosphatase n=1 Tax=Nocardioides marmotae TaxID=2663857 RepID=A0A6I3JFA2_9ACTN|nr:SpoIIE family protein phosphatase [Nocardioides marmotae]MCR6033130.1 SpoIIE family protein phosphatase [Gordonia jinghuaiqii]MBC9732633.1 SpoIIE family protein phosphatase [Nocardioides marmotae]MTB83750.1 SpoIIE family protein phosphatase [Nocardioides marmotae]MTB96782.1 SpoIIE family protein phosphatase [Nocardioides marmotae]QKE03014.1 SpoIIE family protein phosphatase [Nocardioides marmotae]
MTTTSSTDADTSFDRYARMVRRALRVPVALVSLVEQDRQVFPGAVGLPPPYQSTRETPLSHSFCQYVVADQAPLVVADARLYDRVRDNLAIPDLGVVAYAGWPITDHTGTVVGSLCAIDDKPHPWRQDELDSLADLAAACSSELAERGLRAQAVAGQRDAQDLARRSRVLLALSEGLSRTQTLAEVAAAVEQVSLEQLDCLRAGLWLHHDRDAATADLPTAGPASSPEVLRYVEPASARSTWESAARHAALRVDDSNPVGLALSLGEPLFFPSVRAQNERWPELANDAQVGEGRLFLPLVVQRRRIGTLVLVWDEPRELGDADLATYRAMAAYAAQAVVRGRLHQDRIEALMTLQSAMLPRLPQPDDLQLAARYRPSAQRHQVGGDWYDAVVMPDGVTALMIGDVVGHDIAAAAVMGQLRTMLRALAWAVDDAPSGNVARLDRALRELDVDAMATLVYARLEQDAEGRRVVRWTNAGHPPPLVVEADGSTRWLEGTPDLLLGVSPGAPRGDHRSPVDPGSTLLLYTDGLIERRGEDLREGMDRLAASAARHVHRPAGDFLDRVLHDLDAAHASDDVAVLAVRFGEE